MRALFTIVLAALCLAMLAVPALKAARPAYGQSGLVVSVVDQFRCAETESAPAPLFKPCGKQANSAATLCHTLFAVLPAAIELPVCSPRSPMAWASDPPARRGPFGTMFRPPRLG